MQINSDINTAVVVATRFRIAHINAKNADSAIRKFTIDCPTGIISDEQKQVLRDAATLLQQIIGETTEHAAMDYLKKLEPVTDQSGQ